MGANGPLIAVAAYGASAPSTRVRLLEWLAFLGFEAELHQFAGLSSNTLGQVARHAPGVAKAIGESIVFSRTDLSQSTVVVSREASPFSRGSIEGRILRGAQHGVYDFDDALFSDCRGLRKVYGKREKCDAAVGSADVVIAGNDYLAEWASVRNRDVRVIPTCVNPSRYIPKTSWDISGTPTIVWLGSPSTEQYLWEIGEQLRIVHERTGAIVKLISANGETPPAYDSFVKRVRWTEIGFASELIDTDVAIGPLPNSDYARGKCAYKLLQYAAAGIPMIASPVGANRAALSCLSGWSVDAVDDWADALCEVLSNPSERKSRAEAALLAVQKEYSFQAWAPKWKDAVGR